MIGITTSEQATHIVQALAAMPGGSNLLVTSRRFPRVGPAENNTTYEKVCRSFRPGGDSVQSVFLPKDADEVEITLQGTLPRHCRQDDLVLELNALVLDEFIAGRWGARAKFNRRQTTDGAGYELTVFTDAPAPVPAE